MDVLRATQLLTDFAYLLLGVVAVRAALRFRERVRVAVALIFGTLALVVTLQEITLLGCASDPTAPPLDAAQDFAQRAWPALARCVACHGSQPGIETPDGGHHTPLNREE